MVAKRPGWFFDEEGATPEEVVLHLKRPPVFAHLTQEQWADKIRTAVSEVEAQAAAKRAATGRRILGRKAVLAQSPFACPKTCPPRRRLRPRVATRNKWRRIEVLQQNKHFQRRYREAYRKRRAGDTLVMFPPGTYWLADRKLVHVEAHPARE